MKLQDLNYIFLTQLQNAGHYITKDYEYFPADYCYYFYDKRDSILCARMHRITKHLFDYSFFSDQWLIKGNHSYYDFTINDDSGPGNPLSIYRRKTLHFYSLKD